MFRPQIQKTRVLVILAILNLTMVFIASNSTITDVSRGYNYKLDSAKIMDGAIKNLKKDQIIINN